MEARLDRFRKYFDRLDPTSTTPYALSDELYATPPGRSTGEQLAARLQLSPSSSHLVLGGVGAGKSTQLYRALQALRAAGDTTAVYVDVSRRHDLDKDLAGVLLILAGLELAKLVDERDPNVNKVCEDFRKWAYGHREFIPDEPDYDEYVEDQDQDQDHEPGAWRNFAPVIAEPLPPLGVSTQERIEALKTLKAALPREKPHFVVFFDSLDRLDDVEAFRKAAIEDVRALKQAGIGFVVVGPMRLLYGPNRPVVDIFEQVHVLPAFDVARDPSAREFFVQVIAKRTDETVVGPDVRNRLISASGGLLRDLLHLTRSAVEAAFVAGAAFVTSEHVDRAVDELGRTLMFGLRKAEVETLANLRRRGSFVPTDDNDIALLESRRVIEYQGVTRRYAVHPVIEPLLTSIEGKK